MARSRSLGLSTFLIANTIQEADLTKLEEAARFHAQYIMPLADFYELAIRGRPTAGE